MAIAWDDKKTHEENIAGIITAEPKDAEEQALVAIAYMLAKLDKRLRRGQKAASGAVKGAKKPAKK